METNCSSLSQNSGIELFQRPRTAGANEVLPDERGLGLPRLGEARPGSRLLLRLSKCPPVPVTLAPAQLEGQKGDNSIYACQGAGFFVVWVFSGRK